MALHLLIAELGLMSTPILTASATHALMTKSDHPEKTLKFKKLHKRLRRHVGQAIAEYAMIEEGDKVMVCVSGGKDSYAMLDILLNLQKSAPVHFELVAVNMDQKQPGFPEEILPEYLESLGVPYYIVEKDTYSVVKSVVSEGKTTCGVCSRLRRGTLYGFAEEIGATKVALGHHKDDIVETLFLNMFHGGRLKAMPPKLLSDDKRNIIIRPMAFCRENDIERYAEYKQFPIIPCNLCGSQENLQRQNVKAMLQQWDKDTPGRTDNIFSAISKISPSQLADKSLFDFVDLTIDRVSEEKKPLQFEDNKVVTGGNHVAAVELWAGTGEQEQSDTIPVVNV
ncbi:MAG: tRNA 2-thiocytidine biosynthesis protein TtcA [Candidatus Endobugula sp.]|jgi:tRNA 2-thiocytidine biosynthesis protein TtcA